jgi:MoxR-like ATPase
MQPLSSLQTALHQAEQQLNQIVLGKAQQVRLSLTCLLAGGHLLIEDQPGMGKTTLAHALSHTLGLQFSRIQFTSDLLPADILGTAIFERERGEFRLHKGPVFSQVLLADEINRASPKTQSALLEAMEEKQVSIDGTTYPLPEPFFVLATQNPSEQIGTFALPESQLDRFLLRISLGYPDAAAERTLLERTAQTKNATIHPCLSPADLQKLQLAAADLPVMPLLLDYVQAILRHTREQSTYHAGLSPRAGLGLLQAARAHAFISQRKMVLPEDVQAVLPALAIHRILPSHQHATGAATMQNLLRAVPIPI